MAPWIMPRGIYYGMSKASTARAKEYGIQYRPLATTMRNLYDWFTSEVVPEERRAAMIEGSDSYFMFEQNLLKAWKNYKK